MEGNKPRRPLPVPGVQSSSAGQTAQRPGTPTSAPAERPGIQTLASTLPLRPSTPTSAPILSKPTTSHQSSKPGQAEERPPGVGSSSTTFTNTPISEDYRPPELIPEDDEPTHTISDVISDDINPDSTSNPWSNQGKLGNQWGNQSGATAYGWGDAPAGSGWDNEGSTPQILISSRYDKGELHWWNREYISSRGYPGKGTLPVLMAESVETGIQRLLGKRVGSKGLYKVEITPPDIAPIEHKEGNIDPPAPQISPSLTRTASNSSYDPSSHTAHRPKSPRPRPPHVPPSALEVNLAGKPHPDAYFSPKENAWMLLSWRDTSSSTSIFGGDPLPLFIPQIRASVYTLPKEECRMQGDGMGINCLAYATGSGVGHRDRQRHDLTHHFHKYPKSIDGRTLDPPVRHWKDDFPVAESIGGEGSMDVDNPTSSKSTAKPTLDQPLLLDSYVCCQCSFFLVVIPSPANEYFPNPNTGQIPNVIPGVIPLQTWNAYVNDRLENPNPGMSKEQTLLGGLETLLIIIQNHLWKGENRNIKVNGKGFSRRLGWGEWIQSILQSLSFHPETHKNSANPQIIDIFLRGPVITPTTSEGRLNRRRLIRAWVEISSWIAEWKERDGVGDYKEHDLWVKLNPGGETVREMYQRAVGAHVEQIPRLDLPATVFNELRSREVADKFSILGLTPTAWSADLLCFAYLAQIRCDPAHTPTYFGALQVIMNALVQLSSMPEYGSVFINTTNEDNNNVDNPDDERDRLIWETDDHYTSEELVTLIPDDFIVNAWRECFKRDSNSTPGGDIEMELYEGENSGKGRNNYTEALRIVAESRGSIELMDMWHKVQRGSGKLLTIEGAYAALEVPADIDDAMLITVYQMRIEDSPAQLQKMQLALKMISEARDSQRLREFARTMRDPGELLAPTRADWPRGLNQLGNTCYLNSLLQYFYTIKELRSSITAMGSMTSSKAKLLEEVTDDDLKKHRVGGRLVTRREIVRSKQFVSHLADLFHKLEYADNPSVTPSIDLAKLALVTSKDEEEEVEDESNKAESQSHEAGTDSSQDTDVTLVDDLPPRPTHPLPTYHSTSDSSSSATERPHRTNSPISVSSSSTSLYSSPDQSHSPPSPTRSPSSVLGKRPPPLVSVSELRQAAASDSEDVVMRDASPVREPRGLPKPPQNPPPLPPRRPAAPVHNDSVMMFGKQHDVAECMDNCMFQIETALLKFHGEGGEVDEEVLDDPGKTSVVKRLFYGKIRQTFIETLKGEPIKHEKEDLFSHLPVNVGDEVDLVDQFSTFDIYDGLGRYFDDTIEYEGQKVPMEVGLVKLPPLLQVQLQRVQFNRELLQSWKSQAYVKFGETLYMDRFMDTANPEKRKRSKEVQDELNTCRERLKLLTKGKSNNISFSDALQTSSTFFSSANVLLSSISIPVAPQLSAISPETTYLQNEIHRLRTRIPQLKAQLEYLWADSKQVEYELTSVFIHRGSSPSFGHYFFYSRNLPEKPDVWFKYNDEEVTEVGKEEVFRDTTGETANPYLLVFARKGSQVVETVNRFNPAILDDITPTS
ncbi:hypothetical protein F5876DRAFT_51258 [Lentinula aff. lateritia]|uniref:Uncharacterized protein n=1 Tax=Lentinula aff. lateritia TaxID=2804960 RepID=A0ACC1TLY0_9AGAR|nr:hypothetical protein F5876DRAFT_51258 [Lentinula aff. lateritia]